MDNTTVAIKVIKRFSSLKVMSQFEREMTTMTQVSHHNLVKLHGIMREGINLHVRIVAWEIIVATCQHRKVEKFF